ncbi:MAG: choloylglycine hydrolase family protein [Alphaproteobacteria bacterium]|nr:choloylglycine hydrolase family protein [Alphaproteobacteria bacterium]
MKYISIIAMAIAMCGAGRGGYACTGITLKSTDNSLVVARTMDWSREELNNMYVIVPRGRTTQSVLPDGRSGGVEFTTRYGFAGLAVEQPEFVIDGINEAGLGAALFYFPGYGKYVEYNPDYNDKTLADFQVVSWILSQFSTIDQVQAAIQDVRIVNVDTRTTTVHWRIVESSGRQVVLEIVDGVPHFYENEIGVLTNAPGFPWMVTNLNNYVNLHPGTAGPTNIRNLHMAAFGSGSGLHGLPGDMTPPSRFVRAAFLQSGAIPQDTGYQTVLQAFHILNNFDVPVGAQFAVGTAPNNMPSATQWTVATDMANGTIYYHTMYSRAIRSIDLSQIDFETVPYQAHPLDMRHAETITAAPYAGK